MLVKFDSMISEDEQRSLYVKILDMSRETLKLLDEDMVEDAMHLNESKLEVIKFLAENKSDSESVREETASFCREYITLNEMMTEKIAEIKAKIQLSLKNGRIAGKKVCKYQTVSQVGR